MEDALDDSKDEVARRRVLFQARSQMLLSTLAIVVGTVVGFANRDWKGFLLALLGVGTFLYWKPVWRSFENGDRADDERY